MQTYIGTKIIQAEPQNMNGKDGYAVRYPDDSNSWSPKDAFEAAYRQSGNFNFGHALQCLKDGKKVARSGWNGKGMFLFLVPGSRFIVNRAPLLGIYPEGTEIQYHAHIDMKTAQDTVVPWLASQTDVLAEDWEIVS